MAKRPKKSVRGAKERLRGSRSAGRENGPPPKAGRSDRARRFMSTTVEVEGREEVKVVELPTLEPTPWDESAELTVVGTRVPRMDALEKVTGQARYTADVRPAGRLYTALLRGPNAKRR